ncbi:hypothetical protein ACA910_005341 [Epithemia clementina (nom. ined.)]
MFARFCLYADVGGIKPKNVGMVAIFTTLCQLLWPNVLKQLVNCLDDDAAIAVNSDCVEHAAKGTMTALWVFLVWIWVTFFFSLAEFKPGGRETLQDGSTDERQPLTAAVAPRK